ncbi:hypothetical protein BKX96_05115 [Pseudomonas putida]|nr:hypothetical protein BKX96_05115 [Pseudomonas putida]
MLRDTQAIQPRTPGVAAPTPNRATTMGFIRPGMTTMGFTAPAKSATIAACMLRANPATTNASTDLLEPCGSGLAREGDGTSNSDVA